MVANILNVDWWPKKGCRDDRSYQVKALNSSCLKYPSGVTTFKLSLRSKVLPSADLLSSGRMDQSTTFNLPEIRIHISVPLDGETPYPKDVEFSR